MRKLKLREVKSSTQVTQEEVAEPELEAEFRRAPLYRGWGGGSHPAPGALAFLHGGFHKMWFWVGPVPQFPCPGNEGSQVTGEVISTDAYRGPCVLQRVPPPPFPTTIRFLWKRLLWGEVEDVWSRESVLLCKCDLGQVTHRSGPQTACL